MAASEPLANLLRTLERERSLLLQEKSMLMEQLEQLSKSYDDEKDHLLQEMERLIHDRGSLDEVQALRQEVQRMMAEVEAWRSQHAELHHSWTRDRRDLVELQRRVKEFTRVVTIAEQVRQSMEG